MRFKPEDVLMMQRRLAGQREIMDSQTVDACPEGEEIEKLHNPTAKWLNERGIAFAHNRTDRRSTTNEGVPDFAIVVSQATIWIEFKTITGKLSEKQQEWHFLAQRKGLFVHVIRSFDRFLDLMKAVGVE